MKLKYIHWTRSKGIGGRIISHDDFVVKEIIGKKFLHKFSRNESGITRQRKYFLYLLKKENITTKNAIKMIAKHFGVPLNEIGYAGLKDKFAVTEQYITMKKEVNDTELTNLSLKKIKPTNNMISVGDLAGNGFTITLHGTSFSNKIIEEIKSKPMPNYFGLQRFGKNRNNHVIGKYIIKREFGRALKVINSNSGRKFSGIKEADKSTIKFYIHAYQSWIFNEVLNMALKSRKKTDKIKIVGRDSKLTGSKSDKILSGILKKENVQPKDFSIKELSLSCRGSYRKAFINIKDIHYVVNEDKITLKFQLPKGSYATVLINEVSKNK